MEGTPRPGPNGSNHLGLSKGEWHFGLVSKDMVTVLLLFLLGGMVFVLLKINEKHAAEAHAHLFTNQIEFMKAQAEFLRSQVQGLSTILEGQRQVVKDLQGHHEGLSDMFRLQTRLLHDWFVILDTNQRRESGNKLPYPAMPDALGPEEKGGHR